MPTDTKRLAVPEKSVPYQLYLAPEKVSPNPFDAKDVRVDGRKAEEMRPMFIKTKVVTRAKGSAYLEVGDTKVIIHRRPEYILNTVRRGGSGQWR